MIPATRNSGKGETAETVKGSGVWGFGEQCVDKHRRCGGSGTAYGGPVALYLFQNLKNFLAQRVNLNLDKFNSHLGSWGNPRKYCCMGPKSSNCTKHARSKLPEGWGRCWDKMPGKPVESAICCCSVAQLCLTLCNPMATHVPSLLAQPRGPRSEEPAGAASTPSPGPWFLMLFYETKQNARPGSLGDVAVSRTGDRTRTGWAWSRGTREPVKELPVDKAGGIWARKGSCIGLHPKARSRPSWVHTDINKSTSA